MFTWTLLLILVSLSQSELNLVLNMTNGNSVLRETLILKKLYTINKKGLTICMRYERSVLHRNPVCLTSMELSGLTLVLLDHGSSFRVSGYINNGDKMYDKMFLNREYILPAEPDRESWMFPQRTSNNMVTCVSLLLDYKLTSRLQDASSSERIDQAVSLYARTEQYGPITPLSSTKIDQWNELNETLLGYPTLNKILRILKYKELKVSVTIGCPSLLVAKQYNSISYVGKVHDFHVYNNTRPFDIEDWLAEIGCRSSQTKLFSLNNLKESIKENVHLFSTSNNKLCKQICLHSSIVLPYTGKRKAIKDCSLGGDVMRNVHRCHTHCHSIPVDLETIELCENCIIYFHNCPLFKHLSQHGMSNMDNTSDSSKIVQTLNKQKEYIIKQASIYDNTSDIFSNLSCVGLAGKLSEELQELKRQCSIASNCSSNCNTRKECKRSNITELHTVIHYSAHHFKSGTCRDSFVSLLTNLTDLLKKRIRNGRSSGYVMLHVAKTDLDTWTANTLDCYDVAGCYEEHLHEVATACASMANVWWDLYGYDKVAFYDEVSCNKLLKTFRCVEKALGNKGALAYSYDGSTFNNIMHEVQNALAAPLFSSRACENALHVQFNATLQIADSCKELIKITDKIWTKQELADFSKVPPRSISFGTLRYTGFTSPTTDTTSSFAGSTEWIRVTGPRSTEDNLLLIITISCISAILLVIVLAFVLIKLCKRKDNEFIVFSSTFVSDEDELDMLPLPRPRPERELFIQNPSYSGSDGGGCSGLFLNPSYGNSIATSQSSQGSLSSIATSETPLLRWADADVFVHAPPASAQPCHKIPVPSRPPPAPPSKRVSVYVNPVYTPAADGGYVVLPGPSHRERAVHAETEIREMNACFDVSTTCVDVSTGTSSLEETKKELSCPPSTTSNIYTSTTSNIYTIFELEEEELSSPVSCENQPSDDDDVGDTAL